MTPIARNLFRESKRREMLRKVRNFAEDFWWIPAAVFLIWVLWKSGHA